ncbi:MAG: hypothetical protein ACQETL_06255 [Bacteroidota bacterium]
MKKLSILLTFMLLLACDANVEFSGATNHVYRNRSDHQVRLEAFVRGDIIFEMPLSKNDEYIFNIPAREGENNGPMASTRFGANDSLLVYFNDTLVIQYDKGRVEGNPMKISQYELIESEKEPYVFLFEFTNEDYERALERGRVIK